MPAAPAVPAAIARPRRVALGRSGLLVSRLCFGTLPLGPLGLNLEVAAGARLVREAMSSGVNFFDAAESYDVYPFLAAGLGRRRDEAVIASKSYAPTWEGMAEAVRRARDELGRAVVDIFLMHEQESELTLRGHAAAWAYLCEARARGAVRAIGISTHCAAAVEAAARMPELDIVHPLINRDGLGVGGGREAMTSAIGRAAAAGKGVYAMKALGGGALLQDPAGALRWVRDLEGVHAVAVGVASRAELMMDIMVLEGGEPGADLRAAAARRPRRLLIEPHCRGCGSCIDACPQRALAVADGRARVSDEQCVRCGYCIGACPELALKIT